MKSGLVPLVLDSAEARERPLPWKQWGQLQGAPHQHTRNIGNCLGIALPSRACLPWWPGSPRSSSPITARIVCWCWSPVAAGLEINTLLKSRHWCLHDIAPGSLQTWAILIALFAFFHFSSMTTLRVNIWYSQPNSSSFYETWRNRDLCVGIQRPFLFLAALALDAIIFTCSVF